VLLLAHCCAPGRGSEPGVGWNRAVESAKNFDTWVITKEDGFAEETRRHLERHGEIPGLHFVFVEACDLDRLLQPIKVLRYFFYNHWHRRAFSVAEQLHQRIVFDLVHQINFVGYREPGYLWRLDAPFVWGPVGGTQNYPWRFLAEAGPLGALIEGARSVLNHLQLRFRPRVRRAASRARILLAANSTNQRDLARAHGVEPILMLETGIHPVAATPRRSDSGRGALHILWSGDLAPHKGLVLLLKALSRSGRRLPCALRILGTGWLARSWRRMARRLKLEDRVTWLGLLPHPQALEQYRWADVFVFTSLRDTSGNVVLEALAAGVPVICLDHQGVHDMVTEECGVKIPVTTPGEVIARLSEALETLARDKALRARLSAGARARSRDFHWARQGERMTALYREVLEAPAGARPSPAPRPRPEGGPSALRHMGRDGAKRAAGLAAALIERLFDVGDGQRFGILLYHRVAPRVPGLPEPPLNVTPERFREQIGGLIRRGYVITPLREVLRRRASGTPLAPRTVVVTFDDGFASVHAHALPVLREFKAPATVFLNTAYLDSAKPFPFDRWGMAYRHRLPAGHYRPLTSAECQEMARDRLVELGSHTHTHADFRGRPAALLSDTRISVDILRRRFGLAQVSFAFPGGRKYSGHSGEDLMAAVRKVPVTCALTTDGAPVDWRSDPFGWGRFNVYQWDTATTLAAKLKGCYGWAPQLQEGISRSFRAAPIHACARRRPSPAERTVG
jgi:glycosyltransferase involved in cell wall biosynthesis/peptidoglycan/xylan/chitin deacetylase (PgdA/CDA1 family)